MKSRAGQRQREEEDQKRKSKRTEDTDVRKGRKVAKHCVFPMICGSGGSKSRLAKAAGADPAGHRSDEKLHAVVARSTFPSQNVQNTSASDHFWKLWCRKSARRCGAKHISKSKCTKHLSFGPLLEVEMLKKCTPLWREDNYNYNNYNYTTTTKQLQLQLYDCNYTTLITLHHNYNSTTLQLQLQLQYITLHPAVVGEVTTATIATIPANTTPTTFRSISGFALPSLIHNNQFLL